MTSAPIVSKVWSFCNTLRDDGVGNGTYLEHLTFLICRKLANEHPQPPCDFLTIPANYERKKAQLKFKTFQRDEIVAGTRRLMIAFSLNIADVIIAAR